MEKIILALNSNQLNYSVVEFAYYTAKLTGSKLTGIFMEAPVYEPVTESEEIQDNSGKLNKPVLIKAKQVTLDTEKGMHYFKEACTKEKVRYEVFQSEGSSAEDVIFESRFADLLIIDVETAVGNNNESSQFAKEILARAECPVILPPISFKGIDEIIFCYDGSRSSVFAMKQFTYLFPQYEDKKVTVLEVNEEGVSSIYEKDKVRDLLKGHYSQIGFYVVNGDPTIELFTYLLQKKNLICCDGSLWP